MRHSIIILLIVFLFGYYEIVHAEAVYPVDYSFSKKILHSPDGFNALPPFEMFLGYGFLVLLCIGSFVGLFFGIQLSIWVLWALCAFSLLLWLALFGFTGMIALFADRATDATGMSIWSTAIASVIAAFMILAGVGYFIFGSPILQVLGLIIGCLGVLFFLLFFILRLIENKYNQ